MSHLADPTCGLYIRIPFVFFFPFVYPWDRKVHVAAPPLKILGVRLANFTFTSSFLGFRHKKNIIKPHFSKKYLFYGTTSFTAGKLRIFKCRSIKIQTSKYRKKPLMVWQLLWLFYIFFFIMNLKKKHVRKTGWISIRIFSIFSWST